VHEDVEELRPKLKEILYDCAVEIKATKAALYLLDSAIRKFELVTEYGFRSAIPQTANFNHPLVDRCARGRTPFYVNSVGSDPKLSQILFEASTERLLVAPLFSRGELVGMIDMRDKAGKLPFEQPDVPKAQTIADKILNVFATRNIFNQRFITLADVYEPSIVSQPAPPAAPVPTPAPFAAPPIATPAPPPVTPAADLTDMIIAARKAAARIIVPPSPRTLTEGELRAVRDVLRGVLYLPGAIVASLAMTAAGGGVQEIAARNTLSDEAANVLGTKLQAWLSKRGETVGPMKTSVQTPFGAAGAPFAAAQLQKVYTAPVTASGFRGVYLTVAFGETPERSTHELLASLLSQLQLALEVSGARDALEQIRARAADQLLEPPFTKYPALKRHSEAVAARCAAFAQYLDLSAAEVETVTLTALVHDVGMRMLDYDRLYQKQGLSDEELALLREHVIVGAAMVEPVLGSEIARAVLCHHERVDGRGYPHELHGEEIPMASRIVQICDAYVAIVDPDTYQPVEPHANALAAIARGAGAQFDSVLAGKFAEMMGAV
jgi:HD-GYP domain-containing protein (c-di-GMP phosphodiesterase class II)